MRRKDENDEREMSVKLKATQDKRNIRYRRYNRKTMEMRERHFPDEKHTPDGGIYSDSSSLATTSYRESPVSVPPRNNVWNINLFSPPVAPSLPSAYGMIKQLSRWQSACVPRLALSPEAVRH